MRAINNSGCLKKIAVGVLAFAASFATLADDVKWKMATPWPGGPWLERDAKGFAERVKELTDGRVTINVYPGGTLYSPLKVTEAVGSGVAEVGHNWMAYDWGLDKTTALFSGYPGSPTPEGYILWLYEGGGLELYEEYRREKFGVVAFPCAVIGTELFLHSNKRVQTRADYKGLKLRTSGAWADIASRLGASTVVLPGGEVYEALERGIIDATEWGSPEINRPTGLSKVAKYVVTPGVHQPGGFLECSVNQKAWDKLAERDRNMIRLAAKLSVYDSWASSSREDLAAFQELKDGNNEIIRLDDDFMQAVHEETRKWENEQAAGNQWFQRVLESLRGFKRELHVWGEYRLPIGGVGE
jgi:TRAP-type mannitol/chloroaromatic compound transport system substrate-binding protein